MAIFSVGRCDNFAAIAFAAIDLPPLIFRLTAIIYSPCQPSCLFGFRDRP
ncbi:MAG: hypothetical protein AAF685_04460 [Cyanobacteria bacterium P01_C01_bin.89]